MLQATDQLVSILEHTGPLAIQAGAAVCEALLIKGIGQQRRGAHSRLGDLLVVLGLPQTETHFQTVIG
jgi:hypothetical protein